MQPSHLGTSFKIPSL